jgi:hypothetical protein
MIKSVVFVKKKKYKNLKKPNNGGKIVIYQIVTSHYFYIKVN